jgi:hypothetical protein
MPRDVPGIVFFDEVEGFRDAHARTVQVPLNVDRKESLLEVFEGALSLPSYFGRNWDALEESLRGELVGEARLLIVHQDLPLTAEPNEQASYLRLLQELASDESGGKCTVVFPEDCRQQIARALAL